MKLQGLVFSKMLTLCKAFQADFPFRNVSLPWKTRVEDLVSRLDLDEKIAQMQYGGAKANCPTPAINRLGIAPHVWGSECATGLGSDDNEFAGTSFPQPLGLAATWNPQPEQPETFLNP